MKNVNEVLALLNKAVQTNNEKRTWFFSFSGHVNLIDVRLYPEGWRSYEEVDAEGGESIYHVKSAYLDQQEAVNELYYWIKFLLEGQL